MYRRMKAIVLGLALGAGGVACSTDSEPVEAPQVQLQHAPSAPETPSPAPRFAVAELTMPSELIVVDAVQSGSREALFGDLHVHTAYSFDAYAFGTIASPEEAYRYAQGQAIVHPAGFEVQLRQPLDFYAVTDHAMFLGAVKAAADTSTEFSQLLHVRDLHDLNRASNQNIESLPQRVRAFSSFLPDTLNGIINGDIDVELVNTIAKEAWSHIISAAQAHNQPGKFTTFVAYEYTSSTDDRGNLHRNVVFAGGDKLPAMPFSRFHSQNPEGLWDWMDGLRQQGIESLAIPHNSNGSNGQMFKMVDWAGNPLDDATAAQRVRNEPLVEVTQVKGTSETHPSLSDNDEWADFEIMPYRVATVLPSQPSGSYAREALLNGLVLEDLGITNAYQFGLVGASDTHTAAASLDEDNYFSKVGLLDSQASLRGSVPLTPGDAEIVKAAGRLEVIDVAGKPYASGSYETWGASGLTGVWADSNTRSAIYAAFRRKETFATSGPRMRARLFASFDFPADLMTASDRYAQAYLTGVSMGAELPIQGQHAPEFLAWAARDPNSAPLQRLQVIKGWTVDGVHHERVFDVACSDGGQVDPETHRCPDNGARVDLNSCAISPQVGAGELEVLWRDPEFNAKHRAFYYVRALENPTCRWSTWDAVRAGVAPRPDLPQTLQERVWTSPIWVMPNAQ